MFTWQLAKRARVMQKGRFVKTTSSARFRVAIPNVKAFKGAA